MRLHILSDLHLSQGAFVVPETGADLVVLAGDIARPKEALAWATALAKPVLYVPGNHEFYGSSIDGTRRELARLSAGTNVRVLDDDEAIVGGVRFLGSTLWTDFRLFGDGAGREAAIADALRHIRDFSRIVADDASGDLFTPEASAARFASHAAWLAAKLSSAHAGPTVVVTHHAPSRGSIHPRYADSLLNAGFVSDVAHLAGGDRARLWIHGHTHDSFDYDLGGTRVVCNPRGYAKNGVNENAAFDPAFTVDVD